MTFQALKAKMLKMHKHAFHAFSTCLLWGHSNGNQRDQQMELGDDSWYLVLGSFGSNLEGFFPNEAFQTEEFWAGGATPTAIPVPNTTNCAVPFVP